MDQPSDIYQQIVKNAIRLAMHRRRKNTLEELADDWSVSPKTLSFLNNGRWTRVQSVLIHMLIDACREWHHDQAA